MSRRVSVLWAVATLASRAANADEPVRGRVVDAQTGAPVAGALVAGDQATATTAADGTFELPAGDTLVIVADGYAARLVDTAATDERRIELERAGAADEVIHVESVAPDLARPVAYQLDRDDVRAVPGAGHDVLRAAQSLPGVARVPYGLGGLVVRGVSPSGSAVYLDGVEVPAAFHLAAFTSFFPSTMLESLTLIPGGGDAAWGRNTGGVVELRSRAPRRDRWRTGAEISFVDASAIVEGPTAAGGAIALGVRGSYVDRVLGEVELATDRLLPRYQDAQLRWDLPLAVGTLEVLAFASSDHLVSRGADLREDFQRIALRYQRPLTRGVLTVTPWVGREEIEVELDRERLLVGRKSWPAGIRVDALRDVAWGHVAGGAELRLDRATFRRIALGFDRAPTATTVDVGGWLELRWRVADGLTVRPGLRVDRFDADRRTVIDPRLTVSHELGGGVILRNTLGVHHEPPPPALFDEPLSAPRAVHGSIGIEVRLPSGIHASATGYAVFLHRLPLVLWDEALTGPGGGLGAAAREAIDDELGLYTFRGSIGRGRAQGIELAAGRRVGRLTGWLAYTLSRAERTFDPVRYLGWYPYALDQTHNVSAVAMVGIGEWRAGARVRYATGLPYTPFMGVELDELTAEWIPNYGEPLSARLPHHLGFDLRVERAWERRWATIGLYLDVQNVTDAEHVEDIVPSALGEEVFIRGLPIFPSLGLVVTPR